MNPIVQKAEIDQRQIAGLATEEKKRHRAHTDN
jgi:hypothetical protein